LTGASVFTRAGGSWPEPLRKDWLHHSSAHTLVALREGGRALPPAYGANAWARPVRRHSENQSCKILGSASGVAASRATPARLGEGLGSSCECLRTAPAHAQAACGFATPRPPAHPLARGEAQRGVVWVPPHRNPLPSLLRKRHHTACVHPHLPVRIVAGHAPAGGGWGCSPRRRGGGAACTCARRPRTRAPGAGRPTRPSRPAAPPLPPHGVRRSTPSGNRRTAGAAAFFVHGALSSLPGVMVFAAAS
jgi:hypothetical protein